MKKVFIGLIFGIFGFGKLLIAAPDDALASYHFIGSAALAENPNAAKLKKIWALPETVKLRADVLQKLARASGKIFNSSDTNSTALIRPLLDDLLVTESWAELHAKTDSRAELFLAVRLGENRSQLWESNLLRAAKSTKPTSIKIGDSSGWQMKIGGSANVLKFVHAGKWSVVLVGNEQSAAETEFVNRTKNEGRQGAEKNWLEADIDWPRLHSLLPMDFSPFKPARTEIKISGRGGEDLRTTVRVIYPEKIEWKSEPWKIPTKLIRDPLISFTAAQKVAPFFKPSPKIQQLKVNPLTNQIFFWALSEMPFQSYVAMPVTDVTNTSKTFIPQLPAVFNESLKRRDGGALEVSSNRLSLFWKNLPIIVPFLGPVKEDKDFLFGGIFPLVPSTNKPPAELFKQITGRNDLVFYDWEITQTRLLQWQTLSQILPVFSKTIFVAKNGAKRLAPPRVPEQKWLAAVGPMLGNTITEVTYKSPNELNIVRKSHIGLNSLELVLLSHWLAHPDFPFVNPFATTALPENSSPPKTR